MPCLGHICVLNGPPLQIGCVQVVLNKHLVDFSQPPRSVSSALLGSPCGGAIENRSVSAMLSVIWSAWVTEQEPGLSASASWRFPHGQ